MPIEIVAKLDRESAVYLAGEAIQCKVCDTLFTTVNKSDDKLVTWICSSLRTSILLDPTPSRSISVCLGAQF